MGGGGIFLVFSLSVHKGKTGGGREEWTSPTGQHHEWKSAMDQNHDPKRDSSRGPFLGLTEPPGKHGTER